MHTSQIDVTFIINLHREGQLCSASIISANRAVESANASGIRAELLLMLDSADPATRQVAVCMGEASKVVEIKVGDLGLARNAAISHAEGKYVAFMDGDDLCCDRWLTQAVKEAESFQGEAIIHPKFNLFFGRNFKHYFWIHPDIRSNDVRLSRLMTENLWTSSVVARKSLFERFPYEPNRLSEGYGYEDWVWNVQTFVAGVAHITADDTVIFIRRNKTSSLLDNSSAAFVIPDFRSIFR